MIMEPPLDQLPAPHAQQYYQNLQKQVALAHVLG